MKKILAVTAIYILGSFLFLLCGALASKSIYIQQWSDNVAGSISLIIGLYTFIYLIILTALTNEWAKEAFKKKHE